MCSTLKNYISLSYIFCYFSWLLRHLYWDEFTDLNISDFNLKFSGLVVKRFESLYSFRNCIFEIASSTKEPPIMFHWIVENFIFLISQSKIIDILGIMWEDWISHESYNSWIFMLHNSIHYKKCSRWLSKYWENEHVFSRFF